MHIHLHEVREGVPEDVPAYALEDVPDDVPADGLAGGRMGHQLEARPD